jgi:hypothetical protein
MEKEFDLALENEELQQSIHPKVQHSKSNSNSVIEFMTAIHVPTDKYVEEQGNKIYSNEDHDEFNDDIGSAELITISQKPNNISNKVMNVNQMNSVFKDIIKMTAVNKRKTNLIQGYEYDLEDLLSN